MSKKNAPAKSQAAKATKKVVVRKATAKEKKVLAPLTKAVTDALKTPLPSPQVAPAPQVAASQDIPQPKTAEDKAAFEAGKKAAKASKTPKVEKVKQHDFTGLVEFKDMKLGVPFTLAEWEGLAPNLPARVYVRYSSDKARVIDTSLAVNSPYGTVKFTKNVAVRVVVKFGPTWGYAGVPFTREILELKKNYKDAKLAKPVKTKAEKKSKTTVVTQPPGWPFPKARDLSKTKVNPQPQA